MKLWNSVKGYGFISQKEGKDIFVHIYDVCGYIQGENNSVSLVVGDEVEFKIARGKKGPQAKEVVVVSEAGRKR